MAGTAVFEAAFRSSPDPCALIDVDGTVTAVNDAWAAFTPDGVDRTRSGVGADYLATCRRAARAGAPRARDAYRALTDVLLRRRTVASVVYPCTLPGGVRWFRAEVFAVGRAGLVQARHVDITAALESGRRDDLGADLLVDTPRVMTASAFDLALRDVFDGPPHPAAMVLVTDRVGRGDLGADAVAHLDSDVVAVLVTAADHHAAVRRADDVIRAASWPAPARWGLAARTSGDTAASLLARARRMLDDTGVPGPAGAFLDAVQRSERLHLAADDLVTAVAEYDTALARGAPMPVLVDFDRAVLRAEQACVTAAVAYRTPDRPEARSASAG